MSSVKCMKSAIEGLLKLRISKGGFDTNFAKVQVTSAVGGSCSARLTVSKEHCNIGEALHGGMAASLVDIVSTLALQTIDQDRPGVSVDLSVAFLSAARSGSEVVVTADTLKRGRSLAFLAVNITDASTGKLLATGRHIKSIAA